MIITIFTPLYNRAKYLKRVYDSLLIQEDNDLEWIIVDDGSIDKPKEKIKKFIKDAPFKIKFLEQENSGKHIAINKGLNLAPLKLRRVAICRSRPFLFQACRFSACYLTMINCRDRPQKHLVKPDP